VKVTRWFVAIVTASLILAPASVGGARAQPAAGPVASPEGPWREQIHWIPMIDAAGSHHLLQARICRPLGDAPSRVVVIAHGTFPNNRNTVLGHLRGGGPALVSRPWLYCRSGLAAWLWRNRWGLG
jgi:hypothetical protein